MAYYKGECGCGADWSDYRERNATNAEWRKLMAEGYLVISDPNLEDKKGE
jgi:hypothetical protein